MSNTLAVLSLIPGIDSATNFALIFVDAARGDWGSVLLDVVGVLPYVGELTDAARLAKTGSNIADAAKLAKAADKVMDAADAARTLDKAADIAKTADAASKSDFLKNLYKKSVTDATHAAGISKLMGKSRDAAFISNFATKFASEFVGDKGRNLGIKIGKRFAGEAAEEVGGKIGRFAGELFGMTIGSALDTVAGEIAKGEKDADAILRETARVTAIELVSELGSQHMGYTIALANEADSVARKLMGNYTDTDGWFLRTFYEELFMALEQKIS